MLKPSIVFSTFFQTLHKTFVSNSIIYFSTPVMQLLVLGIFIKVHVIIRDKKTMELSFFRNFFYDSLGIDLQPMSNGLI